MAPLVGLGGDPSRRSIVQIVDVIDQSFTDAEKLTPGQARSLAAARALEMHIPVSHMIVLVILVTYIYKSPVP